VHAVQVVAIAHQLEAGASRVGMVEEVEEIRSRQVESGVIQSRHCLSLATPPLRVGPHTWPHVDMQW
jgi:hypothetical protein